MRCNEDDYGEICEIRERQGYRSYDCRITKLLEHIEYKENGKCLTSRLDCPKTCEYYPSVANEKSSELGEKQQ